MDSGLRPDGSPPTKKAKKLYTVEQARLQLSQSLESFGLHDERLLSFIKEISVKAGEIAGNAVEKNCAKMRATVSALHTCLDTVPTSDEKEFRAAMKKYGSAVARHQEAVHKVAEEFKDSMDPGSAGESLLKEGLAAEDRCSEYISMYVAFTMFRNEILLKKMKHGDKAQLESLKGVMANLKQASAKAKEPIFSGTIADINSFIVEVDPSVGVATSSNAHLVAPPASPSSNAPPVALLASSSSEGVAKASKAKVKAKAKAKFGRKRKAGEA
jgi:hypothetical protein